MQSLKVAAVVLAFSGVMSAGIAAAEEKAPNWVKVTDKADWQPRDSSGELVYRDKLWIFGGWFESYMAPPRDVWNSADGKSWTLVEKSAPWKHSDLGMTVTFKDKMWYMGGWYNGRLEGHEATNAVWSSTDGVKWEQAPATGPRWSPRIAGGLVEFKGRVWVLGGIEDYYFGNQKSLKNDVWSSADGSTWTLATEDAGWAPRAYHQAVVHDGKMWILGGGNYVPEYAAQNDVWCSEDGVHWTNVSEHAPWSPRLWFSSVTYRDRMWVLGGWSNNPSVNLGDVWYSRNGKDWNALKSDVIWKERHEHSTYVFQDKIWVAGGHAKPLSHEVWSLDIPKGWFKD